jgi:hypothetical protein
MRDARNPLESSNDFEPLTRRRVIDEIQKGPAQQGLSG